MKLPPFAYACPTSLPEAVQLLASRDAKAIAGGQSLVPMLAFRLAQPELLVDLRKLADLRGIRITERGVTLGAMVRWREILDDARLATAHPLLKAAVAHVAHYQIRNRGTVGGSLAHADPSAELPLVAQILEARLVLHTKSAKRTLPAAEFFAGPMMTNLQPDECLEEIHWPVWREQKTGSAFTEISRRHGDFAMVAATAQIAVDDDGQCTRVTFGVGGAAPVPLAFPALAQNLVGRRLDKAKARAVAQEAAAALEPDTDTHASAAYRRHLAGVLVSRVLLEAYDTARSAP